MEHSFDIEDAVKYDVECAIILKNMRFWLDKNKANDRHVYDGRIWTYNSVKAFQELFPYMGRKQIANKLKKLEDAGVLVSGNYNQSAYDRTKWYSLEDPKYLISPKGEMENNEKGNGNDQKEEPIPDSKPDSKTDVVGSRQKSQRFEGSTLEDRQLSFKNEIKTVARRLLAEGQKLDEATLRAFYEHFVEPNTTRTKMRAELEKTWDTGLRLQRWLRNQKNFQPRELKKDRL